MSDNRYLIFHKDHPMNVAGINAGAEMATLHLARFLVKQGRQVTVCAQLADGVTERDGVSFFDLGPEFDISAGFQNTLNKGEQYHLISCGLALPLLLAGKDVACLSKTLISQDRTSRDTGIGGRVLANVADHVVCVSNAQREFFLSDGIPENMLSVLRNGADLEVFQQGAPDYRNWNRLVFAGALVQDKGIHLLIESFARLKEQFPDLVLDVYGSAGMWGREKLFDEREIERSLPGIRFHGAVTQEVVAAAYRNAGIAVVPSIWFDPFPLTAMEAQVTGCPVVTFNVGGLGEGVVNGSTGVVLDTVSQEALTDALRELLQNREKLQQMSTRALEVQRSLYTWENFANGIIQLCEGQSRSSIETKKQGAVTSTESDVRKRFGFLTTWNQECGLAICARDLLQEFPIGSYVVLAEDTSERRVGEDEEYVERCWKRNSASWEQLREVIERHDLGLIHIYCQPVFFEHNSFHQFLGEMSRKGVRVVLHLHNVFTNDVRVQALVGASDKVIVHGPENRLEAIANGAEPEKVEVIPLGVPQQQRLSEAERNELRTRLGMPENEKTIVCFGFVQPHKGMDGLVDAVADLTAGGIPCQGYLCGKPNPDDPGAQNYLERLKALAERRDVVSRVHFLDRFLSDEEVRNYLAAADVVLMNYSSQHFEASAACSFAIGAGALVAASIAPPFMAFGDAVWHITQGFPSSLSVGVLLTNQPLAEEVRRNAQEYAEQNSWANVALKLKNAYQTLQFIPEVIQEEGALPEVKQKEIEVASEEVQRKSETQKPLRVLVQNRHNTFSQRGGDTIVLEKTVAGLRARGVNVEVDLAGKKDPAEYDLVHLFNFALPEYLRILAERAHNAGTPFVVTSLNEDVPLFHNQSLAIARIMVEYVQRGQSDEWLVANWPELSLVDPSAPFENSWTAAHAAALLTNGARESESIRKTFGRDVSIVEVPLGYEIGAAGDAARFQAEYGVRDFVLCVGRIESRKNQLMLLKALEEVDLPLVLAGGGFTYQPEYAQAVRDFQRKGKTIVLDRVSGEMLASAYAAARVHALPSWYELPGLVSLEAAFHGCNVVVTDNGTTFDYLGNEAFYCTPDNAQSIRTAVLSAWSAQPSANLKQRVIKNTWDGAAEKTLQVYEQVLGQKREGIASGVPVMEVQIEEEMAVSQEIADKFHVALETGEEAAQERRYEDAHAQLGEALRLQPDSVRALRARAAVFLAEEKVDEALDFFEQAKQQDQEDSKTLSGLGMCYMMKQDAHAAHPYFVRALSQEPGQLVAILQLIEASHVLDRFHDLETVLRRYTELNPDELNMQFCLAGCLFKLNKFDESKAITHRILAESPNHIGCNELLEKIDSIAEQPTQKAPDLIEPPRSEQPGQGGLDDSVASTIERLSVQRQVVQPEYEVNINLETRLQEAEEEKRKRNLDEVIDICEEVIARAGVGTPESLHATLLRAEAMILQGDIDDAVSVLEHILNQYPNCSRAMCGLGAVAGSKRNWQTAREYFECALLHESENDVALAGLGLCEAQEGDEEVAWQYYQRALQANPECGRALLGLIEIGYDKGRYGEIERALQAYLEFHPADLDFLYTLAGCLFAQGRLHEAIAEIEKILLFEPQNERAGELREIIDEKLDGAAIPAER